jgi:Ala-tRNA(Pro) deacylase
MKSLQSYLSQNKVPFSVHEHVPAYTAQEMAAEEHVSGRHTAKPVIVKTDDGYAMCVLPAHRKLDLGKATRALNTGNVELASERELGELFPDAEIGAEPPVGELYHLPMLVDEELSDADEVVFQAGTHRHSIHMAGKDYISMTQPQVCDLSVHG